jgi:hypothetical protein
MLWKAHDNIYIADALPTLGGLIRRFIAGEGASHISRLSDPALPGAILR